MTDLRRLKLGLAKDLDEYTNSVNRVLTDFIGKLNPIPLGPEYTHFTTFEEAQENLLYYRMKKKWGAPDAAAQERVRIKSVLDVFESDKEGPSFSKDVYFANCDPLVRKVLYETRLTIANALRKHYRFEPSLLRMPSGESDRSKQGDVSVYAKLRDVKEWRVTAECVDLFCLTVYSVPGLKAVARKHIGKVTKDEHKRLYACHSDSGNCGYYIFRELLLSEVLTIVPGSRIETVPKELDKLRVISCEPFGNMIVQSVQEEGIRRVIRKEFGIDLNTSADIHKQLVQDLDNATIDLRNASNSNFLCWIRWFYPEYFTRGLEKSRSPVAVFKGNDETIEHHWNMVSPMGNGFTFGLMTFTLLCISRWFDDFAHVFGDDIIVHCDVAQPLIEVLDFIGFKVNDEKTFIRGSFRESCGAFTFEGKPLESFNFEWASNACEAHTLVNKVLLLADATKYELLLELAQSLTALVPALCRKVTTRPRLESRWVCVPRSKFRQKRKDPLVAILFKNLSQRRDLRLFCKRNQIAMYDLDTYATCTLENATYKVRLPTHNANAFWTAYWLFSGRCSTPHLKESSKNPLQLTLSFEYEQFVLKDTEVAVSTTRLGGNQDILLFPPTYLFHAHRKATFCGPLAA